eukprot:TRINITY_DN4524_c0_g1_i14.p1 TRINITY_DN4524_c0_g1~~TRINITY_DN4524_c0_g1_i14.p1  ORF type:complete len:576 (-),score=179.62 TRINITY_DN4524_c0_g1_i14:179-1906(-)
MEKQLKGEDHTSPEVKSPVKERIEVPAQTREEEEFDGLLRETEADYSDELRRLIAEKEELEDELTRIKTGAIEALIEKENELIELREQLASVTDAKHPAEHTLRDISNRLSLGGKGSPAAFREKSAVEVLECENASLLERISQLEEEKATISTKTLDVLRAFEAEAKAAEERLLVANEELKTKAAEVETLREALAENKEYKSEWIEEMTRMDERLREVERRNDRLVAEIRQKEAVHAEEVALLRKMVEDPRPRSPEVHSSDHKDKAIAKLERLLSETKRHSEDQMSLRNGVIQNLNGEITEANKRLTTAEAELVKVTDRNAVLELRVEVLEKLKVDLEARSEMIESEYRSKLTELMIKKGQLEGELHLIRGEHDTINFGSNHSLSPRIDMQPLSKELEEAGFDLGDPRQASPFQKQALASAYEEITALQDQICVLKKEKVQLEAELKNMQESYRIEVKNLQEQAKRAGQELVAKEIMVVKAALSAELETVKNENQRLQNFIIHNQKQFADELNFLREELKLAENTAIDAKLQFAQAASDKDYYQLKYKQLLAFMKRHDIKIDPNQEKKRLSIFRR